MASPLISRKLLESLLMLDDSAMYQRSLDGKLYHYGDVETSDHFMVQGLFKYLAVKISLIFGVCNSASFS
jgi:hypothetical protein